MTMPARAAAFIAFTFALLAAAVPVQAQGAVDYETFWRLETEQARRATFNQISPENKANLVRTQLQRWAEAKGTSLTPEQAKLVKELIASISPEMYFQPRPEAVVARSKELEARAMTLFGNKGDFAQAVTMSSYIPPAAK